MKKILSLISVMFMGIGLFTGCNKGDCDDCIKTGDTFNINKTTAPSQYSITFRENAFLGFLKSAQSFNSFGYCMTVEFAGKIPDTKFNMIVYKIA